MMEFSLERDMECFESIYTLNLSKMQRMLRSFRSKLNAIINDAKSSPSAFAAYVSEQNNQKNKHNIRVTYGKRSGKPMYTSTTSSKVGSFESTIMKHEASLLAAFRHLLVKLSITPSKQDRKSSSRPPTLGMLASQALGKHIGGEQCHQKIEKYYQIIPGHFRRHVLVAHLVQECKKHVRSYNFYRTLLDTCVEHKLNLQTGELLDYLMEMRPLGLYQDFHYFYTAAMKTSCMYRMIRKLEETMSTEQYLRSGFTEYVTKLSSSYQAIELLAIAWKSLIKEAISRRSIVKDPIVQIRIGQWTSALVAKLMAIQDENLTSSIHTDRCVRLIAQLSNNLTSAKIQQFASCNFSLNLVLLNSTFIRNQSPQEIGSNHWVKQIRKLFLSNDSINLDVVISSYRTHQNLLALARTCQTFGLYSIGVAIVNGALSRYSEIRAESNISTCPTVKELTIFARELERRGMSNGTHVSEIYRDFTFDSWLECSPATKSQAYGLSCPVQADNLANVNKRKLRSNGVKWNGENFRNKRKISYKDGEDEEYSPSITKKAKTKAAHKARKPLSDITSLRNAPIRPRRQNAGKGVREFWVVPSQKSNQVVENHSYTSKSPFVNSNNLESQLNVKRVRALPQTQIDELCI